MTSSPPTAPKVAVYRYEDTLVFEYTSVAPNSKTNPIRSVWRGGTRNEADQIAAALAASRAEQIAGMRKELAASREKFTMHTAHVHAWFSALVQELGIAKEGETVDVATACSKAMDEIAKLRDKALTKQENFSDQP